MDPTRAVIGRFHVDEAAESEDNMKESNQLFFTDTHCHTAHSTLTHRDAACDSLQEMKIPLFSVFNETTASVISHYDVLSNQRSWSQDSSTFSSCTDRQINFSFSNWTNVCFCLCFGSPAVFTSLGENRSGSQQNLLNKLMKETKMSPLQTLCSLRPRLCHSQRNYNKTQVTSWNSTSVSMENQSKDQKPV